MDNAVETGRYMHDMLNGQTPHPPVADFIGFRIVSLENGRAVVHFTADERHTNPMGTLHGGILCDVGDAAMGAAFGSTMPKGTTFTTLELKMNFLRPVWKGLVHAEGRVIKAGRTVGLTACDIYDQDRNLVAHGTSTLMVLTGEQAQGRHMRGTHEHAVD